MLTLILVSLPEHPGPLVTAAYQIVGLLVTLVVLYCLYLVSLLVGRLVGQRELPAEALPVVAQKAQAPPPVAPVAAPVAEKVLVQPAPALVVQASPAVVPAPTVPPALGADIVATIAAAVAMVIDQPHRILAVHQDQQPVAGPWASGAVLNPWAVEGRVQHFATHKVR